MLGRGRLGKTARPADLAQLLRVGSWGIGFAGRRPSGWEDADERQRHRTERSAVRGNVHRSLRVRYDRATAIPHVRPPAVLGVAPDTAELVRGHTVAAVALVRCVVAFLDRGVIGCRDQGSLAGHCKARWAEAGRLRRSVSGQMPTAWASCSVCSFATSLGHGGSRDGGEDQGSRLRLARCSSERVRNSCGSRRAQPAAACPRGRTARELPASRRGPQHLWCASPLGGSCASSKMAA